jgi:hypothetical protein
MSELQKTDVLAKRLVKVVSDCGNENADCFRALHALSSHSNKPVQTLSKCNLKKTVTGSRNGCSNPSSEL